MSAPIPSCADVEHEVFRAPTLAPRGSVVRADRERVIEACDGALGAVSMVMTGSDVLRWDEALAALKEELLR